MYRRNALAALLTGLAGAIPAARRAAAQHHTMAPATGSGDGRAVLIFAAATLKPALDAIVSVYRAKQGSDVTIAYGPTPALAKQIENGAPADIFLSADPLWMDYLAERRLIRRHTRADLVGNLLILAGRGPQSAKAPVVIHRTFPLAQVVATGPLCMCNPADHPAGRYGKASLEALGLWETVAGKIAIQRERKMWLVTGTSGSDASADSGTAWKPFDSGTFNAMSFVGGAGWAVGARGRIATFRGD